MKFSKESFRTLCHDGVVTLEGYAFDIGNRKLIAHKHRKELLATDKNYHVSERTSGFPVGIESAPTRLEAAHRAEQFMPLIHDQDWAAAIACAVIARDKAKPVPLLKG